MRLIYLQSCVTITPMKGHLTPEEQAEIDANFVEESTALFVKHYNASVPDSFPRATVSVLERFQADNPSLFKDGDEWTVDKHRKKVMDWLAANTKQV